MQIDSFLFHWNDNCYSQGLFTYSWMLNPTIYNDLEDDKSKGFNKNKLHFISLEVLSRMFIGHTHLL